ncbi:MAG: amidohydrolase family protein [Pseudomonadales bacterium]
MFLPRLFVARFPGSRFALGCLGVCLASSIGHAAESAAIAKSAPRAEASVTVIRAGGVFDSRRGTMSGLSELRIAGERVASAEDVDANPGTIDFSNAYIVPGLIDAHVHLLSDPSEHGYNALGVSLPAKTIKGVVNAQRTLNAGITTVRMVGADGFGDVALRDAINRGELVGPRILTAGQSIGITGGHCGDNNLQPYEVGATGTSVADGPWAMRAMVRQNRKYGADLIKTCSTGGVLSKGTEVGAPQGSIEELTALVAEAHSHGMKVASHAHGATGIKNALRAGVDSIEHASFIDDEGIKLAKRNGTALVMDVYVTEYILGEGEAAGILPESLAKERRTGTVQRENFRKAHKAGVRMVFGTDAGVYPHGDNLKQLSRMTDWGMTPAQALQSATIHAAELLGLEGQVGTLTPGAYADFVVVQENPLNNIETLLKPIAVFKGGKRIR